MTDLIIINQQLCELKDLKCELEKLLSCDNRVIEKEEVVELITNSQCSIKESLLGIVQSDFVTGPIEISQDFCNENELNSSNRNTSSSDVLEYPTLTHKMVTYSTSLRNDGQCSKNLTNIINNIISMITTEETYFDRTLNHMIQECLKDDTFYETQVDFDQNVFKDSLTESNIICTNAGLSDNGCNKANTLFTSEDNAKNYCSIGISSSDLTETFSVSNIVSLAVEPEGDDNILVTSGKFRSKDQSRMMTYEQFNFINDSSNDEERPNLVTLPHFSCDSDLEEVGKINSEGDNTVSITITPKQEEIFLMITTNSEETILENNAINKLVDDKSDYINYANVEEKMNVFESILNIKQDNELIEQTKGLEKEVFYIADEASGIVDKSLINHAWFIDGIEVTKDNAGKIDLWKVNIASNTFHENQLECKEKEFQNYLEADKIEYGKQNDEKFTSIAEFSEINSKVSNLLKYRSKFEILNQEHEDIDEKRADECRLKMEDIMAVNRLCDDNIAATEEQGVTSERANNGSMVRKRIHESSENVFKGLQNEANIMFKEGNEEVNEQQTELNTHNDMRDKIPITILMKNIQESDHFSTMINKKFETVTEEIRGIKNVNYKECFDDDAMYSNVMSIAPLYGEGSSLDDVDNSELTNDDHNYSSSSDIGKDMVKGNFCGQVTLNIETELDSIPNEEDHDSEKNMKTQSVLVESDMNFDSDEHFDNMNADCVKQCDYIRQNGTDVCVDKDRDLKICNIKQDHEDFNRENMNRENDEEEVTFLQSVLSDYEETHFDEKNFECNESNSNNEFKVNSDQRDLDKYDSSENFGLYSENSDAISVDNKDKSKSDIDTESDTEIDRCLDDMSESTGDEVTIFEDENDDNGGVIEKTYCEPLHGSETYSKISSDYDFPYWKILFISFLFSILIVVLSLISLPISHKCNQNYAHLLRNINPFSMKPFAPV